MQKPQVHHVVAHVAAKLMVEVIGSKSAQWSEDGMNLLRRSLASETFSDSGSFPPDPRTAEATRRS